MKAYSGVLYLHTIIFVSIFTVCHVSKLSYGSKNCEYTCIVLNYMTDRLLCLNRDKHVYLVAIGLVCMTLGQEKDGDR